MSRLTITTDAGRKVAEIDLHRFDLEKFAHRQTLAGDLADWVAYAETLYPEEEGKPEPERRTE